MKISVEFTSLEEMAEFASKFPNVKKNVVKMAKEKVDETIEKVTKMTEEAPKEETPKEEETYTLTEVRAKLAEIAKTDKTKVAEILKSVGAAKLTDVKEEDYAAIMERAGV